MDEIGEAIVKGKWLYLLHEKKIYFPPLKSTIKLHNNHFKMSAGHNPMVDVIKKKDRSFFFLRRIQS